MKELSIRVLPATPDGRPVELPMADATDVLTILQRSQFTVAAPCGGSGTCGKCVVRVTPAPEPTRMEQRLLSAARLAAGYRFACRVTPRPQLTVEIPQWESRTRNKNAMVTVSFHNDPFLTKAALRLPVPSIADQRPDLERVLDACANLGVDGQAVAGQAIAGQPTAALPLAAIQSLATDLRRQDYSVTALLALEPTGALAAAQLIAVEPGDTTAALWGVAVDIGTTTVAAYLVDLHNARAIDVYSELNRQAEFGADVVTRISYAQRQGIAPLQGAVVSQLNQMVRVLAARNGLVAADVYLVAVCGNTTMMHLFAGMDPTAIGVAPFIPVATRTLSCAAVELGLAINRAGRVMMIPGISGYVGADVVAAVEASRMRLNTEISLLIDIGTNGEIVLGNADWMVACSTAAGPAFEGAQIRFGVGGIDGAVNTFSIAGYTTINSTPAGGICGSGILDIVAVLLETGVVDETGRLLPAAELPATVPSTIRERCTTFEGVAAFLVAPASETNSGEALYLTEGDVREIQLAKAAIAAGVDTLIDSAAIEADQIARVYLAGGFGSYMNAESALRVGLLPATARGKVEVIGNAAGVGAVMALTSRTVLAQCAAVARNVRYIELSSSASFQMAYIERMSFEVTA